MTRGRRTKGLNVKRLQRYDGGDEGKICFKWIGKTCILDECGHDFFLCCLEECMSSPRTVPLFSEFICTVLVDGFDTLKQCKTLVASEAMT
jgi:hypothetical protein